MIKITRRLTLSLISFVFVFTLFPILTNSQTTSTILFRENFENPGPNTQYGFGYKYVENGNWTATHMPNGGYNGGGAGHLTMFGGRTQYSFGWAAVSIGRTFTIGDGFYMRFRIKFDENMRANEGWGNKFIMMGNTGTTPNSRFIYYMTGPSGNSGCTLAMRSPNDGPWAYPSYYGINQFTSFADSPLKEYSWSIMPKVNIGWDCAPPIYMTTPANIYNGLPGANSAMPVNGWYHVQVYVQSGVPGQGQFKVWANNNNYNLPTTQKIGLTDGLGVDGWGNGPTIGGYMDTATPSVNLGYTIDDFEIGTTFDPSWYASGSLPPPSDTTSPTVSVTAPGGTVSNTVTVSASASDNIGVSGVQFKLNGVNLSTEDTTAPYSVTWNTNTATNGTHTITATARDSANNTTTSTGITVTVNNTVTPTPLPAPTADIRINNSTSNVSLTSGVAATISWTSTNATTCSVTPNSWTGISGTQTVILTATTTYAISCSGTGGTATDAITLNVIPIIIPPVVTTPTVPPIIPTSTPPTTTISVGDRVQTIARVNVRATPSGRRLGSQSRLAQGTVLVGPTNYQGYTWYKVNYDKGVDGWTRGDLLTRVIVAMGESEIRNSIANIYLLIQQLQERLREMGN